MTVGDTSVSGYFPLTEPVIEGEATRVMSLRDGLKKMSKSDPSDLSRINLTDDADTIARKIRKAKTDVEPLPTEAKGLEGRPEADNLVGIYAALADMSRDAVVSEFAGKQFSAFKPALADLAVEKLAPIAGEMRRLMADPGHIDSILKNGGERAGRLLRRPWPMFAISSACCAELPLCYLRLQYQISDGRLIPWFQNASAGRPATVGNSWS